MICGWGKVGVGGGGRGLAVLVGVGGRGVIVGGLGEGVNDGRIASVKCADWMAEAAVRSPSISRAEMPPTTKNTVTQSRTTSLERPLRIGIYSS